MKRLLLLFLLTCALTGSALAQIPIPSIVTDGLAAYQENGSQAAMSVWNKGALMDTLVDQTTRLNSLFSQVELGYGKMTGYEPIRVVVIAPSLLRVYILLKFDKGPLYGSFDCYKTKTGWIIASMDCNTKPEIILPPGVFGSPTP